MRSPVFQSENDGKHDVKHGDSTLLDEKVVRPSLWKVLLHNDDYTTMEFVVLVLKKYFGKTHEDAEKIMLEVHHNGVGVCGIYTKEIAETKVDLVIKYSRANEQPLLCSMEME